MRIIQSRIKWNSLWERWELTVATDDGNEYEYSYAFKETAEAKLLNLIKRCGKGE